MSLTTLVKEADVRERLRLVCTLPLRRPPPSLRAPVITRHPSTVGIAFDYLLRLLVRRANPFALERDWVADEAIRFLRGRTRVLALRQVAIARRRFVRFLKNGSVTPALLQSAIDLARLDPIARAREGHRYLGAPYEANDFDDLRQLVEIVPRALLKRARLVVLNPTFGWTSQALGADADLLINDTLIEVKVVREASVRRVLFNQLVGYALLSMLGGIDGVPRGHRVRAVALYFARHGCLRRFPINSIVSKEHLAETLVWLEGRLLREERRLLGSTRT